MSEQWKSFEISDLIAPAQFPGGLKMLTITLFPGEWENVKEYGCDRRCADALFNDMQIELEPINTPRLDGKLQIFD
jgi:hypothetical protein